ncbi:MAG: GNAT family N-acetyltransferase [Sulfurimonas sp.]|nr:GNAT family N-acetyltransferase [Sulfurimonas sp.]MBU3939852.1 GNAT family N-acetyltransferase [bacterium]MBU4025819.1 GNAT family N-acetyltransferase [bacterium]MBU4058771.1 GNAT family N-acetyltransferase [bacterium]
MSLNKIIYLNRKEYVTSIEGIQNDKSIAFANMSLKWWDEHYGWYTKGCLVLTDAKETHLAYVFYKIDKYNEYITIHNIFTPFIKRRNGYANELMEMLFDLAIAQNVTRFKLTSISKSLDFYLSLGFIYWGVNSVGDYYCDMPMPHDGLSGVNAMVLAMTNKELIGRKRELISKKIKDHSQHLNAAQTLIYNDDLLKLKCSYREDLFLEIEQKTPCA